MLKILVRPLLIGILMFAGFTQLNHPHASLATSGAQGGKAADKSILVEVTFDGLMVFERVPDSDRRVPDHYEVGVLPRGVNQDHYFRIIVKGKDVPLPAQPKSTPIWNLVVVTPSGQIKGVDIFPRDKKPCNRLLDTTAVEDLDHQNDFCWIIDLENDFGRPRKLALAPDALRPVISLNNGELYTKSKYDEQLRQDSHKNFVAYGFVAETMALRIKLEEGEKVELRVPDSKDPAKYTTLFQLDENTTSAALLNAPRANRMNRAMSRAESHFHRQYNAYVNVGNGDYDVMTKAGGLRPINRSYPPDMEDGEKSKNIDLLVERIKQEKATVPRQLCGIVYLGRRRTSLSNAGAPQ